jgi:hypothetical protein
MRTGVFPGSLPSIRAKLCVLTARPAHGRVAVAAGKLGEQPVAGKVMELSDQRGSPHRA